MIQPTKKVLITGSAGFIGFHAALQLHARKDFVIGCDNFNSYYDPALKSARAHHLQQIGIDTIHADICDGAMLQKLIEENQITHVLHLAAQAGVRHSALHPEDYVHSNLNGFVSILEALKHHPHIPLIYASSSSVYGLNKKIPFSEEDPTDSPASFYGATKKCNEVIAQAYHHLYGIRATGLRFFTVYGPWGRPDMAYFLFTKAILEEKPIPVYGDGTLLRDFTYIDDIVSGIIAAIDLSAPLEIFNLGNNSPHNVLELIALLEEHLQKKARIALHPIPPGDVPITYADISKSQRLLHYEPRTPLSAGLKLFIQWHTLYTQSAPSMPQLPPQAMPLG